MRLKANHSCFVEVAQAQAPKHLQRVPGDVFYSKPCENNNRLVLVLSDGLGSGVKANVLATLTATMAALFIEADGDYAEAAALIMKTLPICSERKIAYSTFSIIDIDAYGLVNIYEYESPRFLMIRNGKSVKMESKCISIKNDTVGERKMQCTKFTALPGDRIMIYSDGVTQSGLGFGRYPLGWGEKKLEDYACSLIAKDANLSAQELADALVYTARSNDLFKPMDDITCATVYFREPRNLLVVTGPSMAHDRDKDMARIFSEFSGKKIICGGTTAKILARETNQEIFPDDQIIDLNSPPTAKMKGADLVTEGSITLDNALTILENDTDLTHENGATSLINMMLASDAITFLVGTKINQAHWAPDIPIEFNIRKNTVRRIANILETKFLKDTEVRFI